MSLQTSVHRVCTLRVSTHHVHLLVFNTWCIFISVKSVITLCSSCHYLTRVKWNKAFKYSNEQSFAYTFAKTHFNRIKYLLFLTMTRCKKHALSLEDIIFLWSQQTYSLLFSHSHLHVHTSFSSHLWPPVYHQVRVSISSVCRGDLSISLESPGGTVSLLLDTRPNDASTDGLRNWTLMTAGGSSPEDCGCCMWET